MNNERIGVHDKEIKCSSEVAGPLESLHARERKSDKNRANSISTRAPEPARRGERERIVNIFRRVFSTHAVIYVVVCVYIASKIFDIHETGNPHCRLIISCLYPHDGLK